MRMINNISFLFRLRCTYRANSVINVLRSLPLIKKIVPAEAYGYPTLKSIAYIIAALMELSFTFSGKLLYLIAFLILPSVVTGIEMNSDFAHLFIAGTLAGGIANSRFDNATKDSYYAVFFLRMSARSYALTEMLIFLVKMFIGFVPFSLLAWFLFDLDMMTASAIPIFVVCIKLISAPFMLWYAPKIESATGRSWLLIAIALLIAGAAILSAVLGFSLPQNSVLILTLPLMLLAGLSLWRLVHFKGYKEYYRKVFSTDWVVMSAQNSEIRKQTMEKSVKKQITNSTGISSNKKGFGYFNDLFVKRHRKVLMRVAAVIAVIAAVVFASLSTLAVILGDDGTLNEMVLNSLPYFLMIMYAINCSNRITYTMFVNCDDAMLNYGFYRTPWAILHNFIERLRSIILINLLPGGVIALGMVALLASTGGTDNPIEYLFTFFAIIAMSIFFSVHGLVLYYLLQPYNAKMEIKNPIFSIINIVTYAICFVLIGEQIPTVFFGSIMIAFCIIYVFIAMLLVFKFAPRTFKLRR